MQAKSFLNEQGKENQFSDIILKKTVACINISL